MFYSSIRPITKYITNKPGYEQHNSAIQKEVKRAVQHEIAKIAQQTNHSPYIEDHQWNVPTRYESYDEGSWKNATPERVDTQASFDDSVLRKLNII